MGCEDDASTISFPLPSEPWLTLETVSYAPRQLTRADLAAQPEQVQNTILLTTKEQIDPNLTITAGNRVIRRVRDVRGRAIYGGDSNKLAGTTAEQAVLSGSRFGLLERDNLEPDTWLQVNSHTILMNVSLSTAGQDTFPAIRLTDPGSGGVELTQLARTSIRNREPRFRLHIGEHEFCTRWSQCEELVPQAFLPLFTGDYNHGQIEAYVDTVRNANPGQIRIVSRLRKNDSLDYVGLQEHAQVVLEETGTNPRNWLLDCDEDRNTLLCEVPSLGASPRNIYSVWVDQPPYFENPGIWGKGSIAKESPPQGQPQWREQAYALGDWLKIQDVCTGTCKDHLWNAWRATITVKHATDFKLEPAPILELVKRLSKGRAVSKGKDQGRPNTIEANCNPDNFQTTQGDKITLTIPFQCFPAIPETLLLRDRDEEIDLPELREKLLPSELTYFDLGDHTYRLEGKRLSAFDQVRLEGQHAPKNPVRAIPGYDSLDFNADLQPGRYNVFLVMVDSGVSVPAKRRNDKGQLEQIAIVVP